MKKVTPEDKLRDHFDSLDKKKIKPDFIYNGREYWEIPETGALVFRLDPPKFIIELDPRKMN